GFPETLTIVCAWVILLVASNVLQKTSHEVLLGESEEGGESGFGRGGWDTVWLAASDNERSTDVGGKNTWVTLTVREDLSQVLGQVSIGHQELGDERDEPLW